MRTLIRAIKRSTLAFAILAVLATCAVFVPPARHASAASSPTISLQYNSGTGAYYLAGQGFSWGGNVFLGQYELVNGQWQLLASDTVTAFGCNYAFRPYGHCTTSPGTFTYNSTAALGVWHCGYVYYYAYDYNTATWSNPIYVGECIN